MVAGKVGKLSRTAGANAKQCIQKLARSNIPGVPVPNSCDMEDPASETILNQKSSSRPDEVGKSGLPPQREEGGYLNKLWPRWLRTRS